MMHRFFTDNEIDGAGRIRIQGSDVKHARDVLRMGSGEKLEIVVEGKAYLCSIIEIGKNIMVAELVQPLERGHESSIKINLFQGLPKSTKMETILQKATELGVSSFYPLLTNRTVVRLKGEKKQDRKLERWESVVHEAAKQSKRDTIPKVHQAIDMSEIEAYLKEGITIVPYEASEDNGIKDVLRSLEVPRTVNIVIGPEGGFEEDEIDMLVRLGARIVSLGPRILRTETAGIVACAIVQYEFGDLGVI
ncbi:MAG TPA: 16S rRNA (uracil(1498)-N(3))-methyltransferase [Tissierellaceae bacterium]|nr:16S rRNA (uracil(1498)-N(3))-methyltransferase [Tissierellaceae bacterium]